MDGAAGGRAAAFAWRASCTCMMRPKLIVSTGPNSAPGDGPQMGRNIKSNACSASEYQKAACIRRSGASPNACMLVIPIAGKEDFA